MSNSQTGSSPGQVGISPYESYQPTVRVMRLYKPGFHQSLTFPSIPSDLDSISDCTSDNALSPFLLLPDSFGDIYTGEKFSAYIAVVNGYPNAPFHQVSLSVRLQTASNVFDLIDIRASTNPVSRTLSINEAIDLIVQHTLTELGIHTLRVSVQYMVHQSQEPKTLRKFYRFNVLQPLILQSYFIEVNSKPMVQCQVTNSTKSPICLDQLDFFPSDESAVFIATGKDKDPDTPSKTQRIDEFNLLQPDESYYFSFECLEFSGIIGRNIGHPVIKWCTNLGESSIFHGEPTMAKSTINISNSIKSSSTGTVPLVGNVNFLPTNIPSNTFKYTCLFSPSSVPIGEEFNVEIRIYNITRRKLLVALHCQAISLLCTDDIKKNEKNFPGTTGPIPSRRITVSSFPASATTVNTASPPIKPPKPVSSSALPSSTGLCVTGLTGCELGEVEAGEFLDTAITLFSLSAGFFDLPTVYFVDVGAKEAHPLVSFCKILVKEN